MFLCLDLKYARCLKDPAMLCFGTVLGTLQHVVTVPGELSPTLPPAHTHTGGNERLACSCSSNSIPRWLKCFGTSCCWKLHG